MSVSALREIKIDNPVDEVVTLLTELLSRATRGEIIGLIGVAVNRECLSETFNTPSLQLRDACFAIRKMEIQLDGLITDELG